MGEEGIDYDEDLSDPDNLDSSDEQFEEEVFQQKLKDMHVEEKEKNVQSDKEILKGEKSIAV